MRRLGAGGLLWVFSGAAWAGAQEPEEPFAEDPVVTAIQAELARAHTELKLPDLPPPYHLAALVVDVSDLSLQATLGGLVSRTETPRRTAGFVVRSGSPQLDNTNFDAARTGVGSTPLVLGDDVLALRKDAWWRLDVLYKQSVEALAAKEAAMRRRAEPDEVPDFAPGEAQRARASEIPRPFDAGPLEALARDLSAIFLTHPQIEWSTVYVEGTAGRRLMLDTGGTDVIEPVSALAIRVVARVHADDGAAAVDDLLYVVRDPNALPPREQMLAETEALAARLERWRTLPVLQEEYVGPVLFADGSAVDVVRHVLVPALMGTPPQMEPPRGSRIVSFDDEAPQSTALQLRRRLLPSGFDVIDDPGRERSLPSSYRYDDEGVAARNVELVTDGIVRSHLMSRIPSEAVATSNGHGRARPGNLVRALPADLRVTGAKTRSDKALHKAALKLAGEYARGEYMVIRRVRDPAVNVFDGGPMFTFMGMLGQGDNAFPPPLEVSLVRKDGTEEHFRGASIGGLDRRALKEVVASGETHVRTVLWRTGSFDGPNKGFPVTLASPELLFGELVVSPMPVDAEKRPKLGSPLAR